MRVMDVLSNNILKNISRLISVDNNIMFDVKIVKKNNKQIKDNDYVFGYEKSKEVKEEKITKALILFKPTLRFLKSIGVDFDSDNGIEGELPIFAFFKEEDKLDRGDEIYTIVKSNKDQKEMVIERGFIVNDIKSIYFGNTFLNTYSLSVIR